MRVRSLVLCVVLLGAALGAAGCSSSAGKAPVGKPGGTVTVKSGNKVVCVITLDQNGTGTCKVSTANYTPGKVTFTGTYNGSGKFNSGSGSTTLTVLPAKQSS
jgi:Bacterial Ig-like domain (group 3)